jgi:hypothetical protein
MLGSVSPLVHPNYSSKLPKLLLENDLTPNQASGTIPAQAFAPVVRPELAKPQTENDDVDID